MERQRKTLSSFAVQTCTVFPADCAKSRKKCSYTHSAGLGQIMGYCSELGPLRRKTAPKAILQGTGLQPGTVRRPRRRKFVTGNSDPKHTSPTASNVRTSACQYIQSSPLTRSRKEAMRPGVRRRLSRLADELIGTSLCELVFFSTIPNRLNRNHFNRAKYSGMPRGTPLNLFNDFFQLHLFVNGST
jgi:hypothetical protein